MPGCDSPLTSTRTFDAAEGAESLVYAVNFLRWWDAHVQTAYSALYRLSIADDNEKLWTHQVQYVDDGGRDIRQQGVFPLTCIQG